MVRHTVRRAAALAATGALAVLATAGPALATAGPNVAGTATVPNVATAVSAAAATQPAVAVAVTPTWCPPGPGLLSSLLYAVDALLGALL